MKTLFSITLAGVFAIATSIAAEVGKEAPAFTAKNPAGEEISLSDFKDKVVVLEWFNYECPFVQKHYNGKYMQKLQTDYAEKDVVWLTVSSITEGIQGYLEPEKLAEKLKEFGNKATQIILDADTSIGKAYDAKVTPHMMIIAKDGTLAYSGAIDSKPTANVEDIESAEKLFENALDAVISGNDVPNAKNQPYGCGVRY